MVERIVRQANENLTMKDLKTILTISQVKKQICTHEVESSVTQNE